MSFIITMLIAGLCVLFSIVTGLGFEGFVSLMLVVIIFTLLELYVN